jgi:hypothetical protein
MKATFKAKLCTMESPLWNLHIPVPDKIYQEFKKAGIKRVVVRYKEMVERPAAFMGKGDGSFFLMINKAEAKKLKLEIGESVDVSIEKDKSKYGMPMPEEMQELMDQDPEANKHFHALTPGVQRSLLYILGKPKQSQKRLEKAIILCEYLKSVNGALDFKEMVIAFKESRFRRS